jgi:hypothetical protein
VTCGCCDPSWQTVGRIVTKDAEDGTVHTSPRRPNKPSLATVVKLSFVVDEIGFHNNHEVRNMVKLLRLFGVEMLRCCYVSIYLQMFVFGVGSQSPDTLQMDSLSS